MADGGGWWGSLTGVVNAAKNKSAEVLEFVKRDLDELSSTVKNEASQVVNSTTSVLKEQLSFDLSQSESTVNTMKRSMSSFLGTVNTVLNPAPDDSEQEAMVMRGNIPVVLTRVQAQVHTLMTSEETFLAEPSDIEATQFSAWLDIQEDLLNNDSLTKLMVTYAELHSQYTKLVPSKVSHADFWQRFLFRRALLEDEEARRQAQERRQHREAQEAEQVLNNHEDEFSSSKMDISDEEQIRLLQEYEKECKTKPSDELETHDSTPSSPRKLPLKENHYSDGKSPENGSALSPSDEDSEKSLISDAKNKLFSFVKTAIDSLDLLENDYETEESSSVSSYEKCPKSGETTESDNIGACQNLDLTMRDKGDMVVLGKSRDKDDSDTGNEDSTVISSSSSSSATLPDDEWEKLQAVEAADAEDFLH
ncbi:BSD domain-containing protein 1-like isoform X2 [Thrips palmi]|uniref:BSD domain-containing protein 1-like isoform X2 n=1 Tax=Thrips palmi TaxID=161013 RepID=A0A6P8ZAV6_THRPL|nr:BSD domain-containing protein 1-like isoform X2 [Thrips palmi]